MPTLPLLTTIISARDGTGLEIPGVIASLHWTKPLSDPDASVRDEGRRGLETALRTAALYGANVDGSRGLIEAALAAGVERIVYTSSIATLGIVPGGAPADGWTVNFTTGGIDNQGADYMNLIQDSAGTITMNDGSEVTFDGIEKIEW